MMFADQLDVGGQALTWVGIASAFITVLGTSWAAYLNYRTGVKKLEVEAAVGGWAAKVKALEDEAARAKAVETRLVAEVSTSRDAERDCKKELVQVRATAESARLRHEKEIVRLRSKLEQTVDWLTSKGMPEPSTGSHELRTPDAK
jgi:hypothetical protein